MTPRTTSSYSASDSTCGGGCDRRIDVVAAAYNRMRRNVTALQAFLCNRNEVFEMGPRRRPCLYIVTLYSPASTSNLLVLEHLRIRSGDRT